MPGIGRRLRPRKASRSLANLIPARTLGPGARAALFGHMGVKVGKDGLVELGPGAWAYAKSLGLTIPQRFRLVDSKSQLRR